MQIKRGGGSGEGERTNDFLLVEEQGAIKHVIPQPTQMLLLQQNFEFKRFPLRGGDTDY